MIGKINRIKRLEIIHRLIHQLSRKEVRNGRKEIKNRRKKIRNKRKEVKNSRKEVRKSLKLYNNY